jgi:error-prone DNA polymerase
MFLLFEDEFGTVNLIVPKAVYERHRHLARAEPLLLARGTLERAQGVVNVIVRELAALERFVAGGVEAGEGGAAAARVHRLRGREQAAAQADTARGSGGEDDVQGEEVGSSMRAAAPAVQSFAQGRRR